MHELTTFFTELARAGRAPVRDWPAHEGLEQFGLARRGDWIVPAGKLDPLAELEIREHLSARARAWLRYLEILPVVGSTNARLMERAQQESVAGAVCTAEVQVQGRGRRGRGWFSPFGANLALSLGMGSALPPARLGGISLVVGLAVLDALEQLGVPGLALKWPNDVLLGGAKLGGILIEMTQARDTELVIGIGLNVALPPAVRDALPAGVTDLSAAGVAVPRSRVAARVLSAVVEFVAEFEELGFRAFRAPFDQRHAYQGQPCYVLLGEQRIAGTVAGVSEQGELMLETADGVRTFHGGEVSLRRGR